MSIQYILEIIGTFAFAISGALAVKDQKHQDWFGASFTAFISSIGGGTLRDILIDSYPLVWISDITIIYAIMAGILVTFIFYKFLLKLRKTLFLFDTFGIALFTIVGTEKALHLGIRPEIAVIMGVFTATMGGVIRDMMTNEIPIIYRKEVYATACFAGACSYLLLDKIGAGRNVAFITASLVIIAIRILAVKFGWSVPRFFR
ncbi:trimeric intracellular cation channel family protein [Dyadobacter fanqingshengii]|uniref:Trimeric intracellular cation channel family protein n=1 Tax=Dyadobacter fanqingshengii TaxID=2906443 RepID=A0A9X1P9A8_9BACT|nr:trimeric intracellular cation channel family protein [Dyadobacter fanqingshengii]MCF0039488.1 trimeric intracellular cation channel family protein [Dyadobacter fanqingshengii]MCF2502972.1 trimeric intracellular cation channel family protein [Dyadobacter fanqingshengii]USJ33703.1 trimeric intracellular cation channel family protein [Dyadobacter fanqingshengii]